MNIDKYQDQLIDGTRAQNLLIFQETIGISKLKNTWIAQIVTIAGTTLGGLTMFSDNKNIIASIGLFILFMTIIIGLILIIKNLNDESNRLMAAFSGLNDYSIRVLLITFFEQKEELSSEESKQKEKLLEEIELLSKELGIVKEDGNLNFFAKNLQLDKINIGNYVLITGLSVGGLFITLSDQIIELIKCFCYC